MKQDIFVQSEDRCDDGYKSLSDRAENVIGKTIKDKKNKEEYARAACEKWLDVRSFGQVFAFKTDKKDKSDGKGVSVGVRGPVSVHQAVSVSPVEIHSIQITKSVNSETSETRSSDTMGSKHMVRCGVYKIKGSINVQLAQKTGFTIEDANLIKECLRTLFENDSSAARPEGSMQVCKLYWWEHNCPTGQYSSAKVHHSVSMELPIKIEKIIDFSPYIQCAELPGLKCEVIDGV